MMQFLIAAPRSGSGKTTVTCAVLTALQRRGTDPCAFKCGPDYIDPMFHRSALGVESHNLDLYLSAPDKVRTLYARYAAGHGAAVCEGAMGFYDGQGLTTRASAWELADTLALPVLLVVQPKGASITLAAELRGLLQFRTPSHIVGILLNDCSEALYKTLRPMLEAETGLPVVGYLPHLPGCAIESRHLGLKTAPADQRSTLSTPSRVRNSPSTEASKPGKIFFFTSALVQMPKSSLWAYTPATIVQRKTASKVIRLFIFFILLPSVSVLVYQLYLSLHSPVHNKPSVSLHLVGNQYGPLLLS